ncbi:nickel pincer cofactor biosynthesis protein LarC [Propionibacteriaceae bacterium Y2011]|uniref:nickel pincer cofactor biosynthesis protein LarC n=1 Tax=Microlunatus sp. Y2014 TaxID=3418488 RepID=UPI003B4D19E8
MSGTTTGAAGARVAWLDCGAGVAGDMLLGALLDAGADLAVVVAAVRLVDPALDITVQRTSRHSLAATKATVIDTRTGQAADAPLPPPDHGHDHGHTHAHAPGHGHGHDDGHGHRHVHDHEHPHDHGHTRSWAEVRELIMAAGLSTEVRTRALGVFGRLAEAEAAVHGTSPDEVHFHEVGALDAIGDVVGCAAALADLGISELTSSVVTVGGGEQVVGEHGRVPIPGPAVTHLARAAAMVITGGPVAMEMTTPTGAALLAEYATAYGQAPDMIIETVGTGAGSRDPERLANVCRVVIGHTAPDPTPSGASGPLTTADEAVAPVAAIPTEPGLVLECNVDDLDPRLWPGVLDTLLTAGAADAWLTPMIMKKGRPAHTLSVLCAPAARARLLEVIITRTSTLGVREVEVTKHVLDRTEETVRIDGHPVRVKLGRVSGRVVNVQPEFTDVADLAAATGVPVKQALARAGAAAQHLWQH